MRIYGVTGWKNSGKTHLMERLVTEITAARVHASRPSSTPIMRPRSTIPAATASATARPARAR